MIMIEQGRNTKVREVTIFLRTLSCSLLLLSRVSWSTPANDNYLEQVWKTTRLWSLQSSNGWWTLQSPEAQVCQNSDVMTQSPIFCIFFRPKSDYCLALSVCHLVTARFGFWWTCWIFKVVKWICQNWYIDFSNLLHGFGFVKLMNSSKLLYGFL